MSFLATAKATISLLLWTQIFLDIFFLWTRSVLSFISRFEAIHLSGYPFDISCRIAISLLVTASPLHPFIFWHIYPYPSHEVLYPQFHISRLVSLVSLLKSTPTVKPP